MGNNPIWHNDPMGDKWGKPGGKAQQNSDKGQADALKASYTSKKDAFLKEYANLGSKMDNYSGDKSSQEYKDMGSQREQAMDGYITMSTAIQGIDAMESDENYYTFNAVDEGEIELTSVLNSEGTQTISINYASVQYAGSESKSNANKAHETGHGAQIAQRHMGIDDNGAYSSRRFALSMEYMPYKIQYFYDASSMPIKIKSSAELREIGTYLKRINMKLGYDRYPLFPVERWDLMKGI